MKTIGSYELKTHLSKILKAVERGETVIIARHGKPIVRISPDQQEIQHRAKSAAEGLRRFPRTRLPAGITIRSLIVEGRE